MNFKYTNTLEQFTAYCDGLLQGFLDRCVPEGIRSVKVRECYHYEMELISKQANEDSNIIKGLWVACLFGMLSEKYDLNINIKKNSCPLIMHLLHILPYYLFERAYIAIDYKYPNAEVSVSEFEVGDKFYQTVKDEVDLFFEDTGYDYFWFRGQKNDEMSRETVGIGVLPQNREQIDYKELSCFYVRTVSINTELDKYIEKQEGYVGNTNEFTIEWEELADMCMLTAEEQSLLKHYQPQNEDMIRKILALAMSRIEMKDKEVGRWMIEENITSREDIYDRLQYRWRSVEAPVYWGKVIQNGQFLETYQRYRRYGMEECFMEEEVKAFSAIRNLPSRWDVLAKLKLYKQYAVIRKLQPC